MSPESWSVSSGLPASDHPDFESLVNFEEFSPPATEPTSPIHTPFAHTKSFDGHAQTSTIFDFLDNSLMPTAPASPVDGDSMLTPAASSFVTPCASPQLTAYQPNKFFPTLFLGGAVTDPGHLCLPGSSRGGSPADLTNVYHTDSDDEEIDVESVCDVGVRDATGKALANAQAPVAATSRPAEQNVSRRRRSAPASTTGQSPSRKVRRASSVAAVRAATVAVSLAEDLTGLDEDMKKRNIHNILERKRREDLKASFRMLRERLPDVAHDERAPKVVILKKATGHIHILKARQTDIQVEKDKLLHQQRALQERLRHWKPT